MAEGSDALSRCRACIDGRRSFLLQGGAGSGKTESLKELLLYIRDTRPKARVVCITHTNAAVAEIVSRVGEGYCVSTIHSFLHGLISHYRKNIRQVIPKLFQLEIVPADCEDFSLYGKVHDRYRRKYRDITGKTPPEPADKKTYAADPAACNEELNRAIVRLNLEIARKLEEKESPRQFYNETKFDSYRDMSFGHDGLLMVFHALFREYELFRRILRDRFDYIFVDEYQDTHGDILGDLLALSENGGPAVCLFGDHMQSIYDRGIGDLERYIRDGKLESIPKEDNYRCSYEVIDLINSLRTDDIDQKVALKRVDGRLETEAERHGSARVWYTVCDDTGKQRRAALLEALIARAKQELGKCKVLILTNREIAKQNGFARLYKIFSDRYDRDARDRIDTELGRVQALEVAELCRLYRQEKYNDLICRVRKNGYEMDSVSKRIELRKLMDRLSTDRKISMWQAVGLAMDNGLIRQTEACARAAAWEERFETDSEYDTFCGHYDGGVKTWAKMKKVWPGLAEDTFRSLDARCRRAQFFRDLFADDLRFAEIRNYDAYLEEETDCITMHRTKGTSIDAVIVVMDELGWNEYDFSRIYTPGDQRDQRQTRSENLIYVACSRARKDLICLRVLKEGEAEDFRGKFPGAEEIPAADLN